jgi:hypothetical protein
LLTTNDDLQNEYNFTISNKYAVLYNDASNETIQEKYNTFERCTKETNIATPPRKPVKKKV